ncbi:F-box only protein 42-like [Asterias rubens]|uniref:F-box only protein 42-like n=1 Tax=Asterias rubens TaxID=7604 RepID=UPI00145544F3|nr:F-box only protein 42-like [Asterias rubens]
MASIRGETCNCLQIENLPEEILERIMSYLSPYSDCKNASLVSRKWHRLMRGVIKQREQAFCLAARSGSLKWSHHECNGNSLFGRSMHSVCYVEGTMYMFGGTVPSEMRSASGTCYCDLQNMDVGTRTWKRLMALGEYPSPKAAASMVHHNGSLILFGGWAPPVPNPPHQPPHISDDLHIYDIPKNKWRAVVTSLCPPPMASHRASMVNDLMVIFGGSCGNQTKYDGVWVLSLQSMTWNCMKMEGKRPPAREKHVQVVLDDGHILIVGGVGNYEKVLNDVWMLDISEVPWKWREINIIHLEFAAPQIFSHSSCKIGDSIVFFSKLRSSLSLALNSHRSAPAMRAPQRPQPNSRTQSHHPPRPQGGVERGSLSDLHTNAKRLRSQSSDKSDTRNHIIPAASCNSSPGESQDSSLVDQTPVGCPCSPTCQCKTPVSNSICTFNEKYGCCKSPSKLGLNPPLYTRIPHGEQQYVLDVSTAISDLQVAWLDTPDQNEHRAAINPGHPHSEMKYGYAPETLFPSLCVGRAEIIRFGGILKASIYPRALNNHYFAY